MFYDLFMFIKTSLYMDLVNAFDLFDFLSIPLYENISLSVIFSSIITIAIISTIIMVVVNLFTYVAKLLKGSVIK